MRFFLSDSPHSYRCRFHIRQDRAHKADRLAVIVCDQLHRIAIDPNIPGHLIECIADIIFCRPDLRQLKIRGFIRSDPVINAQHGLIGIRIILDHAVIERLTDKSSDSPIP